MYEYEMAMLANLAPEKVSEAMVLIPSLKVGRGEMCHCSVGDMWVEAAAVAGLCGYAG